MVGLRAALRRPVALYRYRQGCHGPVNAAQRRQRRGVHTHPSSGPPGVFRVGVYALGGADSGGTAQAAAQAAERIDAGARYWGFFFVTLTVPLVSKIASSTSPKSCTPSRRSSPASSCRFSNSLVRFSCTTVP